MRGNIVFLGFWSRLGKILGRLQTVMRDINTRLSKVPAELPDWLHVDSASIPDIIKSLDHWSKVAETKTTAEMLRLHISRAPNLDALNNPHITPEYRARLQNSIAIKRQRIGEMLDGMNNADLRRAGLIEPGGNPAQARELLAAQREQAIDLMLKSHLDGNVIANMEKEQEWYDITKTFVPPAELWSRHPGYEKFRQFQEGRAKLSKNMRTSVSQAAFYMNGLIPMAIVR